MKHGKVKILFSIMCLIAALALAVFTVYAWFVTFEFVKTNGIDAVIITPDVIDFKITYYYAESEDGKEFKIGDKIPFTTWPDDNQSVAVLKMKEYEPRAVAVHNTDTAVLIAMEITFSSAADGVYPLKANVHHDDVYKIDNFNNFTKANYLSNVVQIHKAEPKNGEIYTIAADNWQSFIKETYNGENNDNGKRKDFIQLETCEISGAAVVYLNFIMDYMPEQIMALYNIMINAEDPSFVGAMLDTNIRFLHDIVFEIGKA